MIRINIHLIIILISIFSLNAFEKTERTNLKSFCPLKEEIGNYQPNGEPELSVGEDLYLVINGGAEIYHEYGFKKALFQTYTNSIGNSINLEIYDMVNNAAAFGIYTFKTGKDGIPLNLGHEGLLESYYLNFWKGNYLVTLTSMQTNSSFVNDLKKLAKAIDNKINFTSTIPPLITYLPEKNLQKNSVTYLKGSLALFNQDIFEPNNIFGLQEGVIGEYPNYSILIIKYMDSSQSIKWFKSAKNYFIINKGYSNFNEQNGQFVISNSKNIRFCVRSFSNMINIIFSKDLIKHDEIFKSIETKIKP